MKPIFILFSFIINSVVAQTYNYYFGNLHSHTGFSDGNKDSLTSGVSQPAGAYNYAKLSQNFDFLGVSEHNHYSSNNNPGFKSSCGCKRKRNFCKCFWYGMGSIF